MCREGEEKDSEEEILNKIENVREGGKEGC